MMKNKNLSLLLFGQLVSQTGDKLYLLALSMMTLEITGSPAKTGMVLFSGLLPAVMAGLFSGVVVDRTDKKAILIITDLLRGLIVSVVAILYFQGLLGFGVILVSQVLLGLNSAFFDPTIPSIIPGIVEKPDLSRANAATRFVSGISNIIGPAAGGIIAARYGYFTVFSLNAVSFFVSAGLECLLKLPVMPLCSQESFFNAFKQGYQAIYRDRGLLNILFMVFVIHFFVGCLEVAVPVIAILFPGKGAANMGVIQSAMGGGTILTALVLGGIYVKVRQSFLLFLAVGMLGLMICLIGISLAKFCSLLMTGGLFAAAGAFIILAGVSFQTLIQNRTTPDRIGRVFAVVSALGNFSIPFAMLVYGFFFEVFAPDLVLGVSGGVILLAALLGCRNFN